MVTTLAGTAADWFSKLPGLYANSQVMRAVAQAVGGEFDLVSAAIAAFKLEVIASTASATLDRWEAELGLLPLPTATDAQREARLVGVLRGFGTTTHPRLAAMANSFNTGPSPVGTVLVIEDFPNYSVILKFVSVAGIPERAQDVINAVQAILPAHLNLTVQYSYMTWHQLDSLQLTWHQFDTYTVNGHTPPLWGDLPYMSIPS